MIKVGIVGASGYTGAELVRLLVGHPQVKLAYLTSTKYQGQKVAALYPNLEGICELKYQPYNLKQAKGQLDFIFVALPHGTSMKFVPELLGEGSKLIDLSGDFRLGKKEVYEKWYSVTHTAPALLGMAAYGLPEINSEKIVGSSFVANPGCYPTASILALAPLLSRGLLKKQSLFIDAKSGVSGAGRTLSLPTHFPECNENAVAYKVGSHQHTPEIEEQLSCLCGNKVTVLFAPHLVPMTRGILVTIYCGLKESLATSDLVKLYRDYYQNKFFVKVLEEGCQPETKSVLGSNYCHLGAVVDKRTGQGVITSAIDNLVKGGAGQAVQNMNLMCGFPEDEGLKGIGLRP